MNFILIIMLLGKWSDSGHAVTSVNFGNLAACQVAAEQVIAQEKEQRNLNIKAICVPEKV